ncbi:hypothetical protein RU95_GL000567 [Enterococcus avium]|nr:hypothetical protein RU95_GL000567 [Enterococcus avium]
MYRSFTLRKAELTTDKKTLARMNKGENIAVPPIFKKSFTLFL